MSADHVVLLRAVNVGGASLPMARLREIAAELGASEVSTYIASGNLLCRLDSDPATFDRALERAIEREFGFFREAVGRSPDQLRTALAAYPFGRPADVKHGHICFLTSAPEPAAAEEFCGRDFGGGERLRVIGDDLHLDYPNGAGKTKLTPQSIVRGLGVAGTARNLRTVAKIIELAR